MDNARATWVDTRSGGPTPDVIHIRRCRITVTSGPATPAPAVFAQPAIIIGRGAGDLRIDDPLVSALHCEVRLTPQGYRLRDLGSTNGTFVKGVRIVEGFIPAGATIGLGGSAIVFEPLDDAVEEALWRENRLASLVGGSPAMRHLFDRIDRIARADTTALIEGETGTGKELVAEALHLRSPRAERPFVVLDCSAIPDRLVEDQLFGHEPGAFTGAVRATVGVFEAASTGTLFFDEIGELPLEAQAKLLRAVETKRVRRLGGSRDLACDVRIVAATNRDLAAEVNRGTFRADLYYRLAVARLAVPPLRDRRDDIPLLVEHFAPGREVGAEFLARAARHAWPGNVRELRNAIERTLLDVQPDEVATAPARVEDVDPNVPFKQAKDFVIDAFEKRYVEQLLAAHDHNIADAARAAGTERMTIYKLMRKHGIER